MVCRKHPRFLLDILQSPSVEFTIVKGNSVLTKQTSPDAQPTLRWLSSEELEDEAMLVRHGGVFAHGGGVPHAYSLCSSAGGFDRQSACLQACANGAHA